MKPLILVTSLIFGAAALAGGVRAMLMERADEQTVAYYSDGARKNAITVVDGTKHGPAEQWYPSGNPEWRGQYADGFRQGEWTFWNEDGSVDVERSGLYEQGKKIADLDA